MNPIIVPLLNGLELTRKAHKTFIAQDIEGGIDLLYINNNSADGTHEWLNAIQGPRINSVHNVYPKSVAESWNQGLQYWFDCGAEHVLVVNNDVELLPSTYRLLLANGGPFVTAVSVGSRDQLTESDGRGERPHPDFSCYLIRREVWETVGEFDVNFKGAFCEDSDFHCRMHKAGIKAISIGLAFYHVGSSTVKNASEPIRKQICAQADLNRAYFKKKWGFEVASEEYYNYFKSPPLQ